MGSVGSSFGSSDASASDIKEYIQNHSIVFCAIGMSHLSTDTLGKKVLDYFAGNIYSHTCLWLSDKSPFDDDNTLGLVVEYGNYLKEYEDKPFIDEKGRIMKVDKKGVIYHYNEKGGLRYYIKSYKDFDSYLGSVGIAELQLDDNPMIFKDFIEECAPIEGEQWIQKKYHPKYYNCHSFTEQAIKILKPKFNQGMIKVKDSSKKKGKSRDSLFPDNIREALNQNK